MISAAETLDYPGRLVSLPKSCTPHHPALCPDIHTPYGNCNSLDNVYVFNHHPGNKYVSSDNMY